jgi:3-hydroxyisobutyrate dehydrogenase-like beta-hydroxyacid dehydrogenase
MSTELPRLALIGFGEAGSTFSRAGRWGDAARAWDIDETRRAVMAECGVTPAASAAEALAGAEIVLSLVTAASALEVAQDHAGELSPGAVWCDMNSVAPDTKRAAAKAVEAAGGHYVDTAVMASVMSAALDAPLLLAGPAAENAMALLNRLGFGNKRIVGAEVGRASAIKMIRSVIIKGAEALTYECAAAAEAEGVLEEVMASLDASERPQPWLDKVAHSRERMATHGLRRAAEMEEAAKTLLDLGIEPVMTRGTVLLQRQAAKTKAPFVSSEVETPGADGSRLRSNRTEMGI